jgi:hypothetical protein
VTHVAKDKGIPPFLIMHVAGHPDTSAQAQRLASVLKSAGVSVRVFGARESTHNKINANLGLPDDPGTKALFEGCFHRHHARARSNDYVIDGIPIDISHHLSISRTALSFPPAS